MAVSAKDFVDGWIAANIHAAAFEPADDAIEAKKRAFECWAAADNAGIGRASIDAECGSLVHYMAAAIERIDTNANRT